MPGACHAPHARRSALLFPGPEGEREARAGSFVRGRKLQAIELPQDATLDARIVQRGARDARARHRAARTHAERHTHAALERGIVRRGDLIAGLKRAHARHHHAPYLLRREPLSRSSCRFARDLVLTAAIAAARAVTTARTAFAVAAQASPTRAARAGTVTAALARTPARIERARAERHAAWRIATAALARALEAGATARAEHDLIRAQTAERVGYRADRAERLLDFIAHVTRQGFGHAAQAGTDLTRLLGGGLLAVAPELALAAGDLFTAALFFLVLGARLFDATTFVRFLARVGHRRWHFFWLEVELQLELLLAGQLERLGNALRRRDRPDQRQAAADRDHGEDERQQQRPIRTSTPTDDRRGGRELEKNREIAVLNQPVVTGHDRDRRARATEIRRILAATAQQQLTTRRAARIELPTIAHGAHRKIR